MFGGDLLEDAREPLGECTVDFGVALRDQGGTGLGRLLPQGQAQELEEGGVDRVAVLAGTSPLIAHRPRFLHQAAGLLRCEAGTEPGQGTRDHVDGGARGERGQADLGVFDLAFLHQPPEIVEVVRTDGEQQAQVDAVLHGGEQLVQEVPAPLFARARTAQEELGLIHHGEQGAREPVPVRALVCAQIVGDGGAGGVGGKLRRAPERQHGPGVGVLAGQDGGGKGRVETQVARRQDRAAVSAEDGDGPGRHQ